MVDDSVGEKMAERVLRIRTKGESLLGLHLFRRASVSVDRLLWVVVLSLISAVHVGTRYVSELFSPSIDMYAVQPFMWSLPAVAGIFLVRWNWPNIRASLDITALAGLIGLIQVVLSMLAGVVMGFGHSPYNHTSTGLVLGLWYAVSILVFREIARWSILHSLRDRREWIAVGIPFVVFWVTAFPLTGFNRLTSPGTAFDYAGAIILPAAATSLFATYVSRDSGPVASLAYLAPIVVFEWSSPILPNLPWAATAAIGVLVPIVGLTLIESSSELDNTPTEVQPETTRIGYSWVVAGLIILFVVWFNTGVFGVKPTLVHGQSMEPTFYTGDVVITRPVEAENLKVGDVIRWDEGSYEVLHRITEIRREGDDLVFITQGDNNEGPDPAVRPEQIKGILVAHVPKAGLPGVYFRRAFTAIMS